MICYLGFIAAADAIELIRLVDGWVRGELVG